MLSRCGVSRATVQGLCWVALALLLATLDLIVGTFHLYYLTVHSCKRKIKFLEIHVKAKSSLLFIGVRHPFTSKCATLETLVLLKIFCYLKLTYFVFVWLQFPKALLCLIIIHELQESITSAR